MLSGTTLFSSQANKIGPCFTLRTDIRPPLLVPIFPPSPEYGTVHVQGVVEKSVEVLAEFTMRFAAKTSTDFSATPCTERQKEKRKKRLNQIPNVSHASW